jgi:UDP-N-acetylmuramate--alanine ligase
LESEDELASLIATHAQSGDLVICLGAGSITKWANALPEQLEAALEDLDQNTDKNVA